MHKSQKKAASVSIAKICPLLRMQALSANSRSRAHKPNIGFWPAMAKTLQSSLLLKYIEVLRLPVSAVWGLWGAAAMGKPPKPVTQKRIYIGEGGVGGGKYIKLADVWHPTLNEKLGDHLGTQCQKQFFFKRICGKHYALQSLRSVLASKSQSWYNCKACEKYHTKKELPKASKYESRVFRALTKHRAKIQLEDDAWVIDSRPLNDASGVGSADIYFHKHGLLLMIDGPSHFVKTHDTEKFEQAETDIKFVRQALKQFHVFRLHYSDAAKVIEYLTDIFSQIAKSRNRNLLFFSESFFLNNVLTQDEVEGLEAEVAGDVME